MRERLKLFLGMVRFSHTVFALPFALASAAVAWSREPFRPVDLAGVVLCMVFARSAAMGFNRLADRRIDAANPRTAGRHLPAGLLSVRAVVGFVLASSAAFVASTALFLIRDEPNYWPLTLSVPVLLFVAGYSLSKRFTALSHYWLGVSLMLAPVAAWVAVVGVAGLLTPTLLGAGVLFWVAGFDILYACQDAEFDRGAGLHSVPARLGVAGAFRVALASHVVAVGMLVAVGFATPELGPVYLTGAGLMGLLILSQHTLLRPADLSRMNLAFFWINAVVSVGLFALIGLDVWLVE